MHDHISAESYRIPWAIFLRSLEVTRETHKNEHTIVSVFVHEKVNVVTLISYKSILFPIGMLVS